MPKRLLVKEFRTLVLWTHLVLGLTGAVVLGVAGGAASLLHLVEVVHSRLSESPPLTRPAHVPPIDAFVRSVEAERGAGQVAAVDASGTGAVLVTLRDQTVLFVDAGTLEVVGARPRSARVVQRIGSILMGLHANLMLGTAGWKVVLIAMAEVMLLAVSGVWLWWRKKHWTFVTRGSFFRVSWDLHSAAGIWSLVPVVVMSGTALLLAFGGWWLPVMGRTATEFVYPPVISRPDGAAQLTPIGLERALTLADGANTGAVMTVNIPRPEEAAYRAGTQRATVWINQYTGETTVQPIATPTSGDHLLVLVERIHTGEQFGIVGLVVMSVASFLLALMAATGLVLGWKRLVITFGGSRRRARDPA